MYLFIIQCSSDSICGKCHKRNICNFITEEALMRNWDMVVMVTRKDLFLVFVLRVLVAVIGLCPKLP